MLDDLLLDIDEDEPELEGAVIGIDLGTTNSVVYYVGERGPKVIPDAEGNRLHPSEIAWLPSGERLIGASAHARRAIDPENTVFSVKRVIGQTFHSPQVKKAMANAPFKMVEGPSQEVHIQTREGALAVPQISGYVLGYLKDLAQKTLGKVVTHCVITVPANFSDSQRAATRRAAELAGMEVLRILNEPTAAALAYGSARQTHQRIAVFDLGGGTFDVTVLAVRDRLYEVLATGGDPFLGGDDVDETLYRWLARNLLESTRYDANTNLSAKAKLVMAAAQIKHAISERAVVSGTISDIAPGVGGVNLSLPFHLTRAMFEQMIAGLVASTMLTVDQVLGQAKLLPAHIDEVILVGGSTRIPLVQRAVAEKFGKRPRSDLNPMEVVAIGAALQADRLLHPDKEQSVLLDVSPHSLRVATVKGFSQVLVPKNTTIPTEGKSTFYTSADNQTSVRIRVCQGESELFDDNVPLGEIVLDGLAPARRGEVSVGVTFSIDSDGILQVTAHDIASGKAAQSVLSVVGLHQQR